MFFYETHHPEPLFSVSVLPNLKHSLSLTLEHFLPLAGNVTWPSSSPNPVICYKEGDGVLLTAIVTDADFHHLSGKNIRECKIFSPLVACIVGSDVQVPTFALKLTLFPNKGFCIGITVHHGVFDGKSFTMFMKAWASISKFGESKRFSSELTPNFDRKLLREQYVELESSYIKRLELMGIAQNSLALKESEPLPDRVRGTFKLSSLDVRKLKELVRDRVPHVSTFTVTFSYVTLCIVRAKGLPNNNRVLIGFPVDMRGRLKPKPPTNYFGNCFVFVSEVLDRAELLGREGMTVIMNSISKSMNELDNGVIKGIDKWLPNMLEISNANDTETTKVCVVGSSRFGYERLDFGWGMPRKADITFIDKKPFMTFTEAGDGGIEVELSLNKHEMEIFSNVFTLGLDKMMKHRLAAL